MNMKTLAAVLSAAALAVTSLSVSAFADPTEVGDLAALKTALGNGDSEIVVTASIEVNEALEIPTGVTIKGKEGTSYGANGILKVMSGGSLSGAGTVDASGSGTYAVYVDDTVDTATISGITMKNGKMPNGNIPTVLVIGNADVTLTGCTVTGTNVSGIQVRDGKITIDENTEVTGLYGVVSYGETVISGTVSSEKDYAIYSVSTNGLTSKVTIKDGAAVDGGIAYGKSSSGTGAPVLAIEDGATVTNFTLASLDEDPNFTNTVTDDEKNTLLTIGDDADVTVVAAAGDALDEALLAAIKNKDNVSVKDGEGNDLTVGEDGVVEAAPAPPVAPTIARLPSGEQTMTLVANTWGEEPDTHSNYQSNSEDYVYLFTGATVADVNAMTADVSVTVNLKNLTVVTDKSKLSVMLILKSEGVDRALTGNIWEVLASNTFGHADTVTLTTTAADIKSKLASADGAVSLLVVFGTPTDDATITSAPTIKFTFGAEAPARPAPEGPAPEAPAPSGVSGGGHLVASDSGASAGTTASSEAAATTPAASQGSSNAANAGDKNQNTGVPFVVVPAVLAAASVIISKKRK